MNRNYVFVIKLLIIILQDGSTRGEFNYDPIFITWKDFYFLRVISTNMV